MKIYPAILTDSFLTLQEQAESVRYSPLIDTLHIDIIDGQLVDNITVGPMDLTVADFEPLKIDFHLMVEEPMDYVFECEAMKDYLPIRRMIGQVERMSYQKEFIHQVRANGWEPVLALDLFTPLDAIDEDALDELRHIHLMAIEMGHQQKAFNPHVLEKVIEIRKHFPHNEQMSITVDGGIKLDNFTEVLDAGASEISVGSALWTSEDPLQTIEEFFRRAGTQD